MSDTAVLVIDMLNAYKHDDADLLIPNVEKIIEPITHIVKSACADEDVDLATSTTITVISPLISPISSRRR